MLFSPSFNLHSFVRSILLSLKHLQQFLEYQKGAMGEYSLSLLKNNFFVQEQLKGPTVEQYIVVNKYKLTNSMAHGTRKFNAAFTRALQ